jgi:hypothetical protein
MNKHHGKGKLTEKDGSWYEGEFVKGVKEGKGKRQDVRDGK